ncbi:MAG: branched-chain amino acid ABC transporter permease [Candidatus Magasanikbacteria bacterium]|jgi:branched-chain amino acid transport system permease protein
MFYLTHILILLSIYIILCLGLNLLAGNTGLMNLSQAAFYGLGSYLSAIFLTNFHLNFFIIILLTIIIMMAISWPIGYILNRIKGDDFALATLGINIIMYELVMNLTSITNGPVGIVGVPRPTIGNFTLNNNYSFLFLCVVALVIIYILTLIISRSSFGRVLKFIRDDEDTAKSFGYKTGQYKLTVFIFNASITAVAGTLFASFARMIEPTALYTSESILILSAVILGGLSNHIGSIFGAVIIVTLPEILRFIGLPSAIETQARQILYGLMLVSFMFYRPQGIFGRYKL